MLKSSSSAICPLCHQQESTPYHQDKKRQYLQCQHCDLVFVPARFFLSPEQEKAEYDLHENQFEDEGYHRFLMRFATPMMEQIEQKLTSKTKEKIQGLEFGCGPAPVLAEILKLNGYATQIYDLYYFPTSTPWESQFDFITATEVIEHIADPNSLFSRFDKMLLQGGLLGLMTKRVKDQQAFQNWHYKNDPTHICFYSENTFHWIAQKFNLEVSFPEKDVVIFYRNL